MFAGSPADAMERSVESLGVFNRVTAMKFLKLDNAGNRKDMSCHKFKGLLRVKHTAN